MYKRQPAEDTTSLKKIGEEITEELEYEPGKLFVNKIVRPKYARLNGSSGQAKSGGEGILIAPMIERPVSYTHLDVYKRQGFTCTRVIAGMLSSARIF